MVQTPSMYWLLVWWTKLRPGIAIYFNPESLVHWSYVSIVFLSCFRHVEFKSGGWFLRFLFGQNSTENAEIFLRTNIEYVHLQIFYPQCFNGDQTNSNIHRAHKGLFFLLIKIEKWAICTWKHHLALLVAAGLTLFGFQQLLRDHHHGWLWLKSS